MTTMQLLERDTPMYLLLSHLIKYGHCMASKEAVQNPANETEIDLINATREAKGISMNALADATGIPYPTLRRSLKGGRALNLLELRAIAATLEVQPSQLLPADLTAAQDAA
jgi:lambda repressor-like predicted transcriptional regulator